MEGSDWTNPNSERCTRKAADKKNLSIYLLYISSLNSSKFVYLCIYFVVCLGLIFCNMHFFKKKKNLLREEEDDLCVEAAKQNRG